MIVISILSLEAYKQTSILKPIRKAKLKSHTVIIKKSRIRRMKLDYIFTLNFLKQMSNLTFIEYIVFLYQMIVCSILTLNRKKNIRMIFTLKIDLYNKF